MISEKNIFSLMLLSCLVRAGGENGEIIDVYV